MTLIIAIPAEDGVVFASDSQYTSGAVRSTGTKIFKLNEKALWGASGEVALIQRVSEQIETFPKKHQPLSTIRDALAGFVKDAVQNLLNLDFRTQFFAKDPNTLLSLHMGDFLFVETQEQPTILHVLSNGTAEWIEGQFAATGNGDAFAHALLHKYAGCGLDCNRAKLLAYKVMEEAIQVGAYGLGSPIDIWEVKKDGVFQAIDEEITALEDTARLLREREVEMLTDINRDGDKDSQVTEGSLGTDNGQS